MSRKAESIYTSRKLNKANREKLEAAAEKAEPDEQSGPVRGRKCQSRCVLCERQWRVLPSGRDCKSSFLTKQISILTI